jgi:UDP-N-acetylmuramate: L-alanyl-gamma-D-glutamyl-meso-diaminopimelate ligase
MVPSNGLILSPKNELAITETLAMGCWTPTEYSVDQEHKTAGWHAEKCIADGSEFIVSFEGVKQGQVKWGLIGDFNIDNGLMAIAAARHAGVPSAVAIEALASFVNTKRRLELKGEVNQVRVFDDFAHHPTAIAKTLAGMRANVGNKRVIAILEPRSNTMKSGVHKDTLANSLADADIVFVYQGEQVKWSVDALIADCKQPCIVGDNVDQMVVDIIKQTKTGDTLLVMSNGGFGGIHDKLLSALAKL